MSGELSAEIGAPSLGRTLAEPFLIAGSGSIGRRHLENLRRLGQDAVLYRSGRRDPRAPAPQAREEYELARALEAGPRAVLVCNPSALHLEVATAAARAGRHLLVEKPLAHSLGGVAELQSEVERRGLVALVGFQYRFHPGLRRVKAWLDDGALGELVSAEVRWGEDLAGWHPGQDWRLSYAARADLGGGALRTLCHPFDYLAWLLGDIELVSALVSHRALGLDVEDLAHVSLRFRSGVLATVVLDYLQRPRAHELELVGTRGRIRWSDADGSAFLHDSKRDRVTPFFPPPGFSRNDMFLDELRHFLACLVGAEPPACGLDDGVRALRVSLAALRSAREHRPFGLAEAV